MLPEGLVVTRTAYSAIVAVQWAAALAIVAGRAARPALLVAAALLVYTMLCDRLWFHHYRHTMAAFSTLLAFAPCDRHLLLGRAGRDGVADLGGERHQGASLAHVPRVGRLEALRSGLARRASRMRGMVASFARLVQRPRLPSGWIAALETPLGASLMAKACHRHGALARHFFCGGRRRVGWPCGSGSCFTSRFRS